MKRIIFLALGAMLLCLTASAQENHYFIDGHRIENFDGSQLEGKTVRHYELKRLEHVTIHNIFTTDDWVKISGTNSAATVRTLTAEEAGAEGLPLASGAVKAWMRTPLIIVDGEDAYILIRRGSGSYTEIYKNLEAITLPDVEVPDFYKPYYGDKCSLGKIGIECFAVVRKQ